MFASEATRSSVAKRVTYSAYSRFATSKPSEQKTAATSAVRHTMRRLGRNLKMMKNSATPSAKEIISRLKRHNQSIAKLRLTLPALRASQVATRAARSAGSVSRSFAIDWLWRFSLEMISFALGVALFFIIFKFLPSRRIVWRTALVAAVFCSLGFEVAKRLYALYVTRFATLDRVASDANIVALFLFLLWVYYTAYLFLLGGEVAEMYDLVRMRRSQRVQLG